MMSEGDTKKEASEEVEQSLEQKLETGHDVDIQDDKTPIDAKHEKPDSNIDDGQTLNPDRELLSLMTGELGNPTLIEDKCRHILLSLAQVFMLLFKDKNNLIIEASAGDIVQGTRTEILKKIDGDFCYCEADIETWSSDIAFCCNNDFIIAIVEMMLGGDEVENIKSVSRALSDIELNASSVFFEVINEALKATITRNPTLHQEVKTIKCEIPDISDETYREYHAVSFSLNLKSGNLQTPLMIIAPQAKILKTDIEAITNRANKLKKKTEWVERLSKQVFNSDILLQANIELERLKLVEISQLQVGDILKFSDEGDPGVILEANGRKIYNCSLGKADNQYMLKIRSPFGDSDWKEGI